ncbi:MAG: polyprenyl synthetase family protein, partial [Planctomycetota bacterium]|nr:polyprenyl synthetase family protein [Planctomycetota bacterium]
LVAGGDLESALPPAAAIEFIHAFSLVHDDLPAMDDDDLRRGRPTLHIARGEAMAILAGDAMMTLAFQILHEDVRPDSLAAALCHELAVATTAMIAGQVYDTLGGFQPNLSDAERLAVIHHNKTGALIRAACRMGALAAGAAPKTLEALTEYGEAVGLMFQIVDDLIDVEQSAEHTGKRTGKDIDAGKLTYPGVLGVERSRKEVEIQRNRAMNALESLGHPAEPLRQLSDFLAIRTR